MPSEAQYRVEHVAETPRGYHVRTIAPGPRSDHLIRVAFPKGPRRKGSGQLVEILHPPGERNPKCELSRKAKANPSELLMFTNPTQTTQERKRAARERAARIRAARLNPKGMVKGLHIKYSPVNAAYFLMWHGSVLRIFETKKEAKAEMDYLLRESPKGNPQRNQSTVYGKAVSLGYPYIRGEGKTAKDGRTWLSRATKKSDGTGPAVYVGWDSQAKKWIVEHENPRHKTVPQLLKECDQLKKALRYRTGNAKRNPAISKQAVTLYESFHGKPAKEVIERHRSAAMRLDYAVLGTLVYLQVITPIGGKAQFNFDGDHVKLASSPDGKQLYCIGGNQNLERCLDAASLQKDLIDLGECQQVEYLARKIHANFEPINYYHKFGEARDGSTKPMLMYDKLKREIFFVGGEYWIDAKMHTISPGIEN